MGHKELCRHQSTWDLIKKWKCMDVIYGLYNGAGDLVGLKVGVKCDTNLNFTFFSQLCAKD